MRPFLPLAVLAVLAATPALAADRLSPAEARVAAAARAQTEASIQLLERLVNINSGTMNLAGVEQMGRAMRAELEPLGFEVRWAPMGEVNRAGHIVATHRPKGARGRKMLLIGHLDTVFEPGSPFQRFERRGDIAEGPGVNDMKGGLVVMLAALKAMHAGGTLKDADIAIVLTGDEERPGRPIAKARADLLEAARHADVALEFESLAEQDGKDMGSIARRSSNTWTLTVKARSGHSSGIFSERAGHGAIYEATRIIERFRTELREPNATYNVGLFVGGATAELNADETGGSATGKDNIIPGTAVAKGDLRTLSNDQTQRLREKMKAIVSDHLGGAEASFELEEGYPAMPPTEGSRALLKELNAVNRSLGLVEMGELDPLRRGAGDIAFVAGEVEGGLIGMGVAGEGSHAPGETIDLNSIERQTVRAALLMTRLASP